MYTFNDAETHDFAILNPEAVDDLLCIVTDKGLVLRTTDDCDYALKLRDEMENDDAYADIDFNELYVAIVSDFVTASYLENMYYSIEEYEDHYKNDFRKNKTATFWIETGWKDYKVITDTDDIAYNLGMCEIYKGKDGKWMLNW